MLPVMTTTESVPVDRRHRRRLETIEEVLDHAVEIMATDGVAGLSLGEIARRMGIRPPSLYVYFPSKNALYDALFARGWRELLETMRAYEAAEPPEVADDLAAAMLGYGRTMGRWSVANIAYAQLLFWRPVPGFRPSDEAYAPAVELYDSGLARMRGLQESGALRPDVDVADVLRDWTVIVAGVVSQQLSNAPGESFDEGRFTSALPALVEMFVAHYGTAAHGRAVSPTTPSRRGHAGKR
jgi:AcrR family transcriptional regulator